MEENIEFKIIGNIGELSLSQRDMSSLKIDFRCLSDSEYELFFSILDSFRIILAKFSLNRSSVLENKDNDQDCFRDLNALKLSLWKTINLSLNINHFAVSTQSLWTLGENFYVDISSYLKSILQVQESDLQTEEDLMDVDFGDEYHLEEFETFIEIISFQEYKPLIEKFFLNCPLFDDSIIICSKDTISMTWQMDLVIPSHNLPFGTKHSKVFHLINFPVTYNELFSSENLFAVDNSSKPVLTFVYDKELSRQRTNVLHTDLFKKLIGTTSSSSNCIYFIGHPEGKLLYCLCTVSSKEQIVHTDSTPEMIYDIKQPIKGIHFQRDPNDVKGNGFLLIIGKLGKLVFITAEKIFQNSTIFKIKNESIYIITLYLPSSVHTYILFKQSIIFISNKSELWVSELSKQESSVPPKKQVLKLSRNKIAMQGVMKIVLINELQGLFLLVTRSGQLYICEYCEHKIDLNLPISLQSLMNVIMHQSSVLHQLNALSKMHQDFFAAVSKFASLKFNGVEKLKVTCSITEIDEPPKKYVISINIASTEKFDSRFWFVTAYLYNFYQKDSIVISKTLQFETDQIITIEVQESLLCSPHGSAFPLYLEVGLLITLPETFRSEESFKFIVAVLPLYIKIETLILNELYLLQSKTDSQQNRSQQDLQSSKNALTEICSRNLKKPIAHALHICHKALTNYPQDFSFCLFPVNSKQATIETSEEFLSMDDIIQILKKRNKLPDAPELHSLTCRNQQMSLQVSENSEATWITLRSKSFFLLVGLRMAIMELLLYMQLQNSSIKYGSKCVSISAKVNKECEKLSKELLSMYGQDVETEGFMEKIINMYCQLRKISRQLPFS
ncbi:uncharacterized protein LOC129975057 [Argiope bruennichi]|uniref:uncharacterized protein LOC129975057 n=1 Tax=Argiope bruennichi TaxID=94029 RepID=UPI00249519C3|nr:uncharacterized protein LOC129975057 [Argiope bruennichi]